MSRVYFHSPSRDAELRGSERAWLRHLATGPARSAWDLGDGTSFDRAVEIVSMVPEVPDGGFGANYLHTYMRDAQAEDVRNKAVYAQWKPGMPLTSGGTGHDYQRRFIQALKTAMAVEGVTLVVAGVELATNNVDLNTALAAGSDAICLAAKIHGWCESHCWVDGPDRAWLADVIDSGLDAGIYRRGMWYVDRPSDNPEAEDDRKWSTQGWEDVLTMLRERDDEPVVLSYSVTDGFPNRETAGMQAAWPEGIERSHEEYGKLSAEAKERYDEEGAQLDEQWYEMDAAEQWDLAMAGLRESKPWARLSADMLREVTFHHPVTVYDLLAPDRDRRVREAVGLDTETVGAPE